MKNPTIVYFAEDFGGREDYSILYTPSIIVSSHNLPVVKNLIMQYYANVMGINEETIDDFEVSDIDLNNLIDYLAQYHIEAIIGTSEVIDISN